MLIKEVCSGNPASVIRLLKPVICTEFSANRSVLRA